METSLFGAEMSPCTYPCCWLLFPPPSPSLGAEEGVREQRPEQEAGRSGLGRVLLSESRSGTRGEQ